MIISACVISSVLSTLALGLSIYAMCKTIGQEKSTHRIIYKDGWEPVPLPDHVNKDEPTPLPGHVPKKGKTLKEQMAEFMGVDNDEEQV